MLNMILLFAYCMNLSSQQMHVCYTLNQHYLDILGSNYLCTFRNLFIDFAIDTPVGQDAHSVYGQNITVGVLPHVTGRLTLLPVLLLLYYFLCKNKVITRNTSPFDFKTYFLRGLGLVVTVCGTKGALPHPKRRLAPAMGQDAHSSVK